MRVQSRVRGEYPPDILERLTSVRTAFDAGMVEMDEFDEAIARGDQLADMTTKSTPASRAILTAATTASLDDPDVESTDDDDDIIAYKLLDTIAPSLVVAQIELEKLLAELGYNHFSQIIDVDADIIGLKCVEDEM